MNEYYDVLIMIMKYSLGQYLCNLRHLMAQHPFLCCRHFVVGILDFFLVVFCDCSRRLLLDGRQFSWISVAAVQSGKNSPGSCLLCLELRGEQLYQSLILWSVVFSDVIVFMIHFYKRVDQCVRFWRQLSCSWDFLPWIFGEQNFVKLLLLRHLALFLVSTQVVLVGSNVLNNLLVYLGC